MPGLSIGLIYRHREIAQNLLNYKSVRYLLGHGIVQRRNVWLFKGIGARCLMLLM